MGETPLFVSQETIKAMIIDGDRQYQDVVRRLHQSVVSSSGVPRPMSTPGYNEERIKAIEKRIAELQLIREKLLLMKKDFENDSKDSVRR